MLLRGAMTSPTVGNNVERIVLDEAREGISAAKVRQLPPLRHGPRLTPSVHHWHRQKALASAVAHFEAFFQRDRRNGRARSRDQSGAASAATSRARTTFDASGSKYSSGGLPAFNLRRHSNGQLFVVLQTYHRGGGADSGSSIGETGSSRSPQSGLGQPASNVPPHVI